MTLHDEENLKICRQSLQWTRLARYAIPRKESRSKQEATGRSKENVNLRSTSLNEEKPGTLIESELCLTQPALRDLDLERVYRKRTLAVGQSQNLPLDEVEDSVFRHSI